MTKEKILPYINIVIIVVSVYVVMMELANMQIRLDALEYSVDCNADSIHKALTEAIE